MNRPEEELELPAPIADRIRARDRSIALLTPEVDRAVIDSAHRYFSKTRRLVRPVRRWAPAVAAAVALVIIAIVAPFSELSDRRNLSVDDIDGSGQVDILDAFALARRRTAEPDIVEQTRIDELARRIVALSGRGTTL
jgi:hypothetical protein